jgi:hypothetical protein
VIEVISFLRIEVFSKTTDVFCDLFQLMNDPIGKPKPLDNFRLSFLFWRWHFLERDLCPNRFPDRGIGLIDRPKLLK